MTLDHFVEDFVIADCSLQIGVPVDQPLATIDQTFGKQIVESRAHGPSASFIEGKARAAPIATGTHAFQLAENARFVLILPLPDTLHEGFATEVMARLALDFLQPFFDDGLSRDAGMVRTRHPESFEAAHAMPADLNILQRVVECMTKMQRPGYIGWRDNDCEWLSIAPDLRMKATGGFPLLINGGRRRLKVKSIGDLSRRIARRYSVVGRFHVGSNASIQVA